MSNIIFFHALWNFLCKIIDCIWWENVNNSHGENSKDIIREYLRLKFIRHNVVENKKRYSDIIATWLFELKDTQKWSKTTPVTQTIILKF